MTKFFDTLWAITGKMPSTNTRIAVSLLMFVATGIRVLITNDAPPQEWLLTLAVFAGLDLGQFHSKRRTFVNGAKTKENGK